jgi:arylsulfatase A-like enzyme
MSEEHIMRRPALPSPLTLVASSLVLLAGAATGLGDDGALPPLDLAAGIAGATSTNRLVQDDHFVWGGSVIEGEDGRYYMFYARWAHGSAGRGQGELERVHDGFRGWLKYSEIACAVADRPEGPYRHVKTVLRGTGRDGDWDQFSAHNPHIKRFGDRVYLYYIGCARNEGFAKKPIDRGGYWLEYVTGQRIGVIEADSVADLLAGKYVRRSDEPLMTADGETTHHMAVNPSVTQRPDGSYLMMFKTRAKGEPHTIGHPVHMVATAPAPTGPFELAGVVLDTPETSAEDPYVWYDRRRDRYFAIVKDFSQSGTLTPQFGALALITSEDGIHDWRRADHPVVSLRELRNEDGTTTGLAHLERPQLLLDEDGQPLILFAAASIRSPFRVPDPSEPGMAEHNTFNVQFRLGTADVASESAEPPNIVLFIVDDMGWQDTSVPFHTAVTPFNERYHTPHMEALAASGTVFTNAYAAAPVCTPTRVAIMTGRSPARHHVTNWTLMRDRDQSAGHPTLRPPAWEVNGLQPDDVTLADRLRDAGYHTIHVGKAHWGAKGTPGSEPLNLGFDVNIAGHAAGGPGSFYGVDHFSATRRERKPSQNTIWDVPGLEAYHGQDIYLTEALTREAVRAVGEAVEMDEPFYLYMSHYAVHAPIMADARFLDRYGDLHPTEAAYATMVEGMDKSLGDIRRTLEELGVADETVIIFTSDNGGLSAHARGGERHTHNAPLRSGKGSAYEGGVRVPMIVHMPGAVDAPARCDVPVISEDLFPTVLALAGAAIDEEAMTDVDGVDITALFTSEGGRIDERVIGWHYPHKWGGNGPGIGPYSAIRWGDHKLIYFHADRRFELYDVVRDVGETTDLFDAEPALAGAMVRRLRAWLLERGAQMSIEKETGERVSLPELPAASAR